MDLQDYADKSILVVEVNAYVNGELAFRGEYSDTTGLTEDSYKIDRAVQATLEEQYSNLPEPQETEYDN